MKELKYLATVVRPHFSEKANNITQHGQYAFRVAVGATKDEIAKAVHFLFKVDVDSVRTVNVQGKTKRHGRTIGKRKAWKKAYVQLKAGQTIDVSGASA